MTNNNENNKKNKQSLNDMLMNILFNIIIPVMILKKGPNLIDNENAAVIALCVALSFPVGFFIYDYIKTKKTNFISILGFVSVLLTGVIGIFQIPNEYLAIKEASVPLIIMLICLGSLFTPFPVVEKLIYNDTMFNKELINSKLEEKGESSKMPMVMRNATLIVAASFSLSTILNYTLAKKIVVSDPITHAAQRTQEIGDLTFWSYIFIALPCTIVMGFAIYYIVSQISKLTGLKTEEMLNGDFETEEEKDNND